MRQNLDRLVLCFVCGKQQTFIRKVACAGKLESSYNFIFNCYVLSSSAPQRSLRRPLIPPAPLKQVQDRNMRIEGVEESPIPPNREINLRGSTLTGHNPTSPTYQHRAQSSVPASSQPTAGFVLFIF